MLSLARAFRLDSSPRLALVGAGGKTTALFALARLLKPPVLVTTTTHLGAGQASLADQHKILTNPAEVDRLREDLLQGVTLLTGPVVRAMPGLQTETGDSTNQPNSEITQASPFNGASRLAGEAVGLERLAGLPPELMERVLALANENPEGRQLPVLVEADGSRLRPLKAPAEHEPVIPGWVDAVIVVAGLVGLGKPVTEEWVHRPDRFAALAGLQPGSAITIEALAKVLSHPLGGLKNIPARAKRSVLLNGVDTPQLQAQAGHLADLLLESFDSIVVASLELASLSGGAASPGAQAVWSVHERVAGIILAAGTAQRFGQVKQLLPWRGEPLVRHVARTALQAGLSPVIVVAGEQVEAIRLAVSGLDVIVIPNPDWQAGQSASLRAGLGYLPKNTGAAVFLLADQPQIPVGLVRALVEAHAAELPPLVAPLVDGQRGNPVLFDQDVFPELLALHGDTGGRSLFARFPATWVPWHDPTPLLDIDTPEDYQKLIQMG